MYYILIWNLLYSMLKFTLYCIVFYFILLVNITSEYYIIMSNYKHIRTPPHPNVFNYSGDVSFGDDDEHPGLEHPGLVVTDAGVGDFSMLEDVKQQRKVSEVAGKCQ